LAAPSKAHAYLGESYVETAPGGGVGDELTGPAKSILERPTFLPQEAAGAATSGGTAEESAAAAVFEGAGVLPMLGSALAFGAGAGIGTLICNEILELEGCWSLSAPEADPEVGGSYVFKQLPGKITFGEFSTGVVPGYEWYLSVSGQQIGTWTAPKGECGNSSTFSGWDSLIGATPSSHECAKATFGEFAAERYSMHNRALRGLSKAEALGSGYSKASGSIYCPAESSTTCATKPPSNWAERFARGLHNGSAEVSESVRDHVGESVAAEVPGSGVKSPYKTYVKVPECSGEAWVGCEAKLEELHLVPERQEVNWSEVETTTPGQVLELAPVPKTEVATKTKVIVKTNPDEVGMPLVVPHPNEPQTYAEYIAKLAPHLKPHRVTVTEADQRSGAGPDGVLAVSPEAGTRLNPNVDHEVAVTTNPASTPFVAGGGCEASVGAINWSPLNQPLGSRFPFGVVAFFVGWVGEWEASGAPHWDFRIIPSGLFGSKGLTMHVNLESMLTVAEAIRVAFLFASFVGLLWFLGTAAMKIQGDNS
jgi:hypothetical protein